MAWRRLSELLILALVVFYPVSGMAQGKSAFELTSAAFKDGARIPQKFVTPAIGGENLSPPLAWENPPRETRSFALAVVDHHPFANNWVHWLVVNIPAEIHLLPEGASREGMPQGSLELINSFGATGYDGPQPPPGTGQHSYVFTVYALNVHKLDLPPKTDLKSFQNALSGKILAEASITGFYEQ